MSSVLYQWWWTQIKKRGGKPKRDQMLSKSISCSFENMLNHKITYSLLQAIIIIIIIINSFFFTFWTPLKTWRCWNFLSRSLFASYLSLYPQQWAPADNKLGTHPSPPCPGTKTNIQESRRRYHPVQVEALLFFSVGFKQEQAEAGRGVYQLNPNCLDYSCCIISAGFLFSRWVQVSLSLFMGDRTGAPRSTVWTVSGP